MQRLTHRFEKESLVRILAVSGMADKPDVIRELLRVKKAKYQTVPDVSNLLMRSFEIQELPTF